MDNQGFKQILQEEWKDVATNEDLKDLATKELREDHQEFFTGIKKMSADWRGLIKQLKRF